MLSLVIITLNSQFSTLNINKHLKSQHFNITTPQHLIILTPITYEQSFITRCRSHTQLRQPELRGSDYDWQDYRRCGYRQRRPHECRDALGYGTHRRRCCFSRRQDGCLPGGLLQRQAEQEPPDALHRKRRRQETAFTYHYRSKRIRRYMD